MSGQDSLENATNQVTKFLNCVNDYLLAIHYNNVDFNEDFHIASNLSLSELDNKNRNELLDYAYVLCSYAGYLQDQFNKNKIVYNWCTITLNNLLVKHAKDYNFDRYVKHEIKIATIVSDNSFARTIDELKLVAESRLESIESKIYELRKKSEILMEKGRRL